MKLVAIDIGYGHVKAVAAAQDGEGKRVSFPSLIAPPDADGAIDTIAADPYHVRIGQGDETPDVAHRVGLAARDAQVAHRPQGDRKLEGDDARTLALTALRALGARGDVALALGLPLAAFHAQKDAARAAWADLTARVALDPADPRRGYLIRVAEAHVFPEGIGAYIADGPMARSILVVDVGYRTTDIVAADGRRGLRIRPDLSGSVPYGMSSVYGYAARALSARLGVPISPNTVEAHVQGGAAELRYDGRDVGLRALLDEAAGFLAEAIEAEIRRLLGTERGFLDAVLLTGGGGQALRDRLAGLHGEIVVPDDPMFSNARGYLAMLERAFGDRATGAGP